jgi:hypothetical protein
MDIRRLPDNSIVDMGKNIAAKLAAHEVTCFTNALADELAAAMDPVNTALETAIEECVVMESTKIATFQAKRDQRVLGVDRIATVQKYLASVGAKKKFYDMLGLPYRKAASRVVPEAPGKLAATGASNGVNDIEWAGNNKSGAVVYELWRRHGDTGDWQFLKLTQKQRATDSPVTPGQYYEYKVRAVAANGAMSPWSNTAVVYGAP